MQDGHSLIPRILVIRFSSLGDVVLADPVFRALKRRLPESSITFLTKSEYAGIHRSNPDVDEIREFDPATRSLSSLIQMVRSSGFSEIIDLHGSLRSRLITLAGGTLTRRFRQERFKRSLMVLRPPFKRIRPITPVIDRYLIAAGSDESSNGHVAEEGVPVVHLTSGEIETGRAWRWNVMSGHEGRLIVLLPGAKHAPKEWPLFHFAELARLIELGGDTPVVVVPPDNRELGSVLQDMEESVILAEPVPDIMELASLLATADGVVANDSGPMHLSAALGTPTVGLFGPTSPDLGFTPRGNRVTHIYRGVSCSPCSKHGQRVCWKRERHCMLDMTPRDIMDALNWCFSRPESPETGDTLEIP
ncbi:glycosyltransferase family 9 protein [Gemmatimonadota bacterium]